MDQIAVEYAQNHKAKLVPDALILTPLLLELIEESEFFLGWGGVQDMKMFGQNFNTMCVVCWDLALQIAMPVGEWHLEVELRGTRTMDSQWV